MRSSHHMEMSDVTQQIMSQDFPKVKAAVKEMLEEQREWGLVSFEPALLWDRLRALFYRGRHRDAVEEWEVEEDD